MLLKTSFQRDTSISLDRYWDDALDIANAMSFIGNIVKNEVPVDMLYSIGLFHDCGIPLLTLRYQNYKKATYITLSNISSLVFFIQIPVVD